MRIELVAEHTLLSGVGAASAVLHHRRAEAEAGAGDDADRARRGNDRVHRAAGLPAEKRRRVLPLRPGRVRRTLRKRAAGGGAGGRAGRDLLSDPLPLRAGRLPAHPRPHRDPAAEPVRRDGAAAASRHDGAAVHQRRVHRLRVHRDHDHRRRVAGAGPHPWPHAVRRHEVHDHEPAGQRPVPAGRLDSLLPDRTPADGGHPRRGHAAVRHRRVPPAADAVHGADHHRPGGQERALPLPHLAAGRIRLRNAVLQRHAGQSGVQGLHLPLHQVRDSRV